jgi:eukaryotic-like serine/threonine-protein kinase
LYCLITISKGGFRRIRQSDSVTCLSLAGRLALNRKDPVKAIELLQTAFPYELGMPRTALQANFGALYAIYVRGEAYLALRKGREAVAEFDKILQQRGIVISDPIGALAHLQVGRAFLLAGEEAKAEAAYQDFLELWKDPDPMPTFRS